LVIWPLKKEDQKSIANRLNELAAVDFDFVLTEEVNQSVDAELALA